MAFWAEHFSKPALRILNALGGALGFSLLEWGLLFALAGILLRPHRLKRLSALILVMLMMFLTVWIPLGAEPTPAYAFTNAQLAAACEDLIGTLNAAELDFSVPPVDLPAKRCAFPFWMRALNLAGFYSFFTGEALISPDAHPAAVPFTAVHEAMHGRGIANEGACNIAAYEECLARGGVYADSARLWALRYALGAARRRDPLLYAQMLKRMDAQTLSLFRAMGGAISEHAGGYEILANYLAASTVV